MRIAFLTQVLPYPLDAGPKVRAYYTLCHLAQRHEVTLISLVRQSDDPEAVAHLESFCSGVITVPIARSRWRDGLAFSRSLIEDEPFLITRDRVPLLYQAITDVVQRFECQVVHADQLWMAPYALAARLTARRTGRQLRLVLDQHNAVYLVPRRMAESAGNLLARWSLAAEAHRMARFEARVCRAFDRVVTVTAEDGRALQALYPNGNRPGPFPVIPICVEPGPPPAFDSWPAAPGILFLGGMHWPPNRDGALWFGREVLPRIWESLPQAQFFAVGRQPPPELHRLASPTGTRATLPGFVADTQAYWSRCRVFVVPLRSGGGMRVKILDAWARGLPVVSTSIGAEGLACRPGEDILIADTPEAFAQATASVLADRALAERLARAGRQTVEQRYDWRKVYLAWDNVYAPLAESRVIG
jgi:glycosyltransferase involved in cell wall biosynthesis